MLFHFKLPFLKIDQAKSKHGSNLLILESVCVTFESPANNNNNKDVDMKWQRGGVRLDGLFAVGPCVRHCQK